MAFMTPRRTGKAQTFILNDRDRAHIDRIIKAGWAATKTGAIRFALKYAADEKAAA